MPIVLPRKKLSRTKYLLNKGQFWQNWCFWWNLCTLLLCCVAISCIPGRGIVRKALPSDTFFSLRVFSGPVSEVEEIKTRNWPKSLSMMPRNLMEITKGKEGVSVFLQSFSDSWFDIIQAHCPIAQVGLFRSRQKHLWLAYIKSGNPTESQQGNLHGNDITWLNNRNLATSVRRLSYKLINLICDCIFLYLPVYFQVPQ